MLILTGNPWEPTWKTYFDFVSNQSLNAERKCTSQPSGIRVSRTDAIFDAGILSNILDLEEQLDRRPGWAALKAWLRRQLKESFCGASQHGMRHLMLVGKPGMGKTEAGQLVARFVKRWKLLREPPLSAPFKTFLANIGLENSPNYKTFLERVAEQDCGEVCMPFYQATN